MSDSFLNSSKSTPLHFYLLHLIKFREKYKKDDDDNGVDGDQSQLS